MIIEKYEPSAELLLAGQSHSLEAVYAERGWSLHSEYLHDAPPTVDDGLPPVYTPEPWNFVVDSLIERFGTHSVNLHRHTVGNYAGALIFLPTEQLEQARMRASEIPS